MKSELLVGCGLLAVWSFACQDGGPTTATQEDLTTQMVASSTYQPVARFLDGELLRIARKHPDFAGLWVDQDGTIVIRATDETHVPQIEVEARELASSTGRFDNPSLRMEPADYGFASLFEWKSEILSNIDFGKLVFVDIDEKNNHVYVAVSDNQAAEDVRRVVADLGIPSNAVVAEVEEPFRTLELLKDHVRPIAGGLGMVGIVGGSSKTCTLGFMAKRSGISGLVTNSHCTVTQGGVEGTEFWQNDNSDPANKIADEWADPYYIGFPGCQPDSFCRWSDSAFAKLYSVWWDPGKIKKTSGLGSTTIVGSWTIVGEASYPLMDETVNKVGFTTGWTQGQVTRTCVDDFASGPNGHMCQDIASASVAGGDSGSPVFSIVDGDNVLLFGVVWAGGFNGMVFSAMGNIEQELGNLQTVFP